MTQKSPKISIIIPTFHESENLLRVIRRARIAIPNAEIIIVDATPGHFIKRFQPYVDHILTCEKPSRSNQMNKGAAIARGKILLFLHADTLLLLNAGELILSEMKKGNRVGGGFSRRFGSSSRVLRVTCFFADLRSKFMGWYFGDQAIFIRASIFRKIGGFANLPYAEDLHLCRTMKKYGKLAYISKPVLSSARRFKKRGAASQTVTDFGLALNYLLKRKRT